MAHKCHALDCHNKCPPRHLMCLSCWQKVPPTIQTEVWNTYDLRNRTTDGSWAPWWRAQAKAIAAVAFPFNPTKHEQYIAREFAFADKLEQKQREKDARPT